MCCLKSGCPAILLSILGGVGAALLYYFDFLTLTAAAPYVVPIALVLIVIAATAAIASAACSAMCLRAAVCRYGLCLLYGAVVLLTVALLSFLLTNVPLLPFVLIGAIAAIFSVIMLLSLITAIVRCICPRCS